MDPDALERDRLAVSRGYDRRGPGGRCDCEWGSRAHGDVCPEHGETGTVIRDPFDVVREERDRYRAALETVAATPVNCTHTAAVVAAARRALKGAE